MADLAAARERMVERQLRRRGIGDERVLAALGAAPRELFVPTPLRHRAYADAALPIAEGQAISQPWIVAAICQALALDGSEKVLEVGTGSGYSACVLALLAREVVSVERHRSLAVGARAALAAAGVTNVELVLGDGSRGVPERAPFEAIAVHAAAPAPPPALIAQLAEGGRLVVPITIGEEEMLTLLRRRGSEVESVPIAPCRFVPLIGEEGF
ncbi:MAG TPA: protein-L-isoaspartate(D-aspartate) O-methyltransferase [Solirubrobacterales bacterium]|nr:protein-L-isoaspartate(D-aspartate) O-methyltransferase [Solirubrobacterales bacterium]